MDNNLEIKDSSIDFRDYFESKGISSEVQSKLGTVDIL